MSSRGQSRRHVLVAGIIPLSYLSLATELGHSRADMLRRAQVAAGSLTPEAGVPVDACERLIRAITASAGDIGIGLETGWRLPLTAFGSLGTAILASATLGDGLKVLQRFWKLYGTDLSLSVFEDGDRCALECAAEPLLPSQIRRTVLESAIAGLYRGSSALLPQDAALEVWFDFPEPVYAHRVRERLGNVRYRMPACQVRFPSSLLKRALPMANPIALREALALCQREEVLRGLHKPHLSARVRQAIALRRGGYPDLEQVASGLHLTSRTLRRQLRLEGTSFLQLVKSARERDAKVLLGRRNLAIHDIADTLGYSNPANFTRAFRQWAGLTPSEYRAQLTQEGI